MKNDFVLNETTFGWAFLVFFGLGDNPYFNILKEISSRSASQTLQDDVSQLRNDCIKVIGDHDLDSKPNKKLKMTDNR